LKDPRDPERKPSPLQLVKALSVVEPGGGSPDSGARAVGSSSASGAQRCGTAFAEPQVAAFLVSFALAAPQGNVLTHAFRFALAELQGTAASPSRRRRATILLAEPQGTIFLVCSVHAEPQDNAT